MYSNDELSIFESQAQFEELNQQCKAIANLPPDDDEGPVDEENMAIIVRASPYDDENAPLYKAYGISGKEINAKRGPIFSADEGRDLTKEEKKYRLESLIDEFSIGRIRKQKAFTLSGGERRRTEIARSLAMEPKFLLLDEPFAGIDPIAVADIKSMIRLLAKRGIGILITDHNVRDTLEITDRAIIINQGTIMIQGSKQEILDSEVAREIYLGKDFSM